MLAMGRMGPCVCLVLVWSGCGGQDEDMPGGETGAVAGSTDAGGATADDGGPGGTETGGAGSGGFDAGGSEAADGETETGDVPAACEAEGEAGSAAHHIDLGDWVLSDDQVQWDIEGACVVASVSEVGETLETQMDCMDGDAGPHSVTFEVSAPPGEPTWAAGDDVELVASLATNGGGIVGGGDGLGSHFSYLSAVGLKRASDGALLVAAVDGATGLPLVLSPLNVAVNVTACGEVQGCSTGDLPQELPLQFTVEEAGGEALTMTGGNGAQLALSDGTTLNIEAPRAHAVSDCHANSSFRVVAARLQ